MEKLMKPAEYAKELGISRQAVYAKIKRGILTAKNVEGQLYIVLEEELTQERVSAVKKPKKVSSPKRQTKTEATEKIEALLEAKEETIAVLKETVKDLKESNKQISTTLRGEIELLKEAFHEMRTLYVHQLEHQEKRETIEIAEEELFHEAPQKEEKWIGIKKFFKQWNIVKEKEQVKVTKRLKKAYKKGDIRLSKENGKLKLNAIADYKDIVK